MPEDNTLDVYSDQMTMSIGPYGIAIVFGATPTVAQTPGSMNMDRRAVVRLSLEHAKVLSMLLRKNIKQYELEHLGDPIPLPKAVLQQLGLANETW